ncbi:38476_t:CDS:2, partial [Gigaspora margarita]
QKSCQKREVTSKKRWLEKDKYWTKEGLKNTVSNSKRFNAKSKDPQ